jgi:hypothetical protein
VAAAREEKEKKAAAVLSLLKTLKECCIIKSPKRSKRCTERITEMILIMY